MGELLPDNSVANRRATVWFGTLLAAGIVLRVAASVLSQGFIYPDEHQEYLEVAQGLVYGPHISWWEYERGIRHYFYPSCLALLLYALEGIGVRDPIYQATIIRALSSIVIFAGIALLARDRLRQGRTPGAFCLLALAALSPDLIYMSIRTLSETAATIPFILSLYFFKRDAFVTGLLLGIMFAVRFQMAFFIPGFFVLSLYDDWSAPVAERINLAPRRRFGDLPDRCWVDGQSNMGTVVPFAFGKLPGANNRRNCREVWGGALVSISGLGRGTAYQGSCLSWASSCLRWACCASAGLRWWGCFS